MNVATGVGRVFPDHFNYHRIDAVDDAPTQNIRQHFDDALNFMRNAVDEGGKVREIMDTFLMADVQNVLKT